MALTKIDDRGLKTPVDLLDDEKIRFGTGNDLEILHSGNYSKVEDSSSGGLILRNTSGADVFIQSDDDVIIGNYTNSSEYYIRAIEGGAVELYHNAVKKFETLAGGIHVTGDVSITGSYLADDDEKIKMGDAHDLQIFHDGYNRICGDDLYINNKANSEVMVYAVGNGKVELYFDNGKKLETYANGTITTGHSVIHGNISMSDDYKVKLGSSDDLTIWHGETNSGNAEGQNYINAASGKNICLQVNSDSNGVVFHKRTGTGTLNFELLAGFTAGGNNALYYDGSKKFETTASGVTLTGGGLTIPNGWNAQWGVNASRAYIQGEDANGNNRLILGTNNTEHININSSGDVKLPVDGQKLQLGASQDLEIYTDAENGYVKATTANLWLKSDVNVLLANEAHSEYYIQAAHNGSVDLYYDGSKKFRTVSSGTEVTGSEWITEGTIYLEKSGAHHHRILANDSGNDLAFQQSSDTGANTNFTSYLRIKDGGDIALPVDNTKLLLGASEDLKIWHGETNSGNNEATNYIESASGKNIVFNVNADGDGIIFHKRTGTGTLNFEILASFAAGGACSLRYDNNEKLKTNSSGITVDEDIYGGSSGADGSLWNNTGAGERGWAWQNNIQTFTILNNSEYACEYINKITAGSIADTRFIDFRWDGNQVGTINYTNNDVVITQQSDYRLKENIVGITDGITKVKQLNPVKFNFKSDAPGKDSSILNEGFLAHELQAVIPQAAYGTKDGTKVNEEGQTVPDYQEVYTPKMVPILTAALKEAIAKIETLETKVAALEGG